MTLLTHLTRNNSQMGFNAFGANGDTVANTCMYKHHVCIVYDMVIIGQPFPALPIPSKNPGVHLPREKLAVGRARRRPACA